MNVALWVRTQVICVVEIGPLPGSVLEITLGVPLTLVEKHAVMPSYFFCLSCPLASLVN